jgi:hypothetical protein
LAVKVPSVCQSRFAVFLRWRMGDGGKLTPIPSLSSSLSSGQRVEEPGLGTKPELELGCVVLHVPAKLHGNPPTPFGLSGPGRAGRDGSGSTDSEAARVKCPERKETRNLTNPTNPEICTRHVLYNTGDTNNHQISSLTLAYTERLEPCSHLSQPGFALTASQITRQKQCE